MRTRLFLLALAVSAFVMLPLAVSYGGGSYENPAPGTFKSPELQGPMMQSEMRDFLIGLRGNNYCTVETIKAESPDVALSIAHNECPTCQVLDISGQKVAAGEVSGNTAPPITQAFCQIYLYTNPAPR